MLNSSMKSMVALSLGWLPLSCSSSSNSPASTKPATSQTSSPTITTSDKDVLPAITLTDAQVSASAKSTNTFGLQLFSKVSATDASGNLLISPLSIQSVFALLYPAAANATEQEFSTALGFDLPQSTFHDKMRTEVSFLKGLGQSIPKDKKFTINIVNDVWVDKTLSLQSDYLDTIKQNYDAGVRPEDFKGNPEAARSQINTYIEGQTNHLIKELLPKDSIKTVTRAVLTNAVYLYANWQNPFKKESTQANVDFTNASGSTSKVSMMFKKEYSPYSETSDYQAVSLKYIDANLALMVILPKTGKTLSAVESSLTADSFAALTKDLTTTNEIDLSLPKFSLKWGSTSLLPELKAMGLNTTFDEGKADFSKLFKAPAEPVYISDVIHQTTIIVDEDGTEAAAATAATAETTGAIVNPPTPKIMKVDHPFIFALYDTAHGHILFLGHAQSL